MRGAAPRPEPSLPPPEGEGRVVCIRPVGKIPPLLAEQCRALGLRLTDIGEAEDPSAVLLAGTATEQSVGRGLTPPFSGFLELGEEGLLGVGLRCFETARMGGLALSLRTDTVYRLSPLDMVGPALRSRLPGRAREAVGLMEICLGEAISNAVMHGNLEVPPHLRINARGFQVFRQVMAERLADPVQVGRRVEIHLRPHGDSSMSVMVSDQGHGFDLGEHLRVRVDGHAKRGRGLGLINRVCSSLRAEDSGRTLVMTFVY